MIELGTSAREDVDRLHAARRRERVPQADVEHVRAEPDVLRLRGEEREVRERVVNPRNVSVGPVGAPRPDGGDRLIAAVNTRCSGSHTDSYPRLVRLSGATSDECRVMDEALKRSRTSPYPIAGCVRYLPSSLRCHPPAATLPPSTWMVVPVTNRLRSLAR